MTFSLYRARRICSLLPFLVSAANLAQHVTSDFPQFGVPGALALHRHVSAGQPFTVAGPGGLLVGQQEGTFEAWVLPVKLLSQVHLTAEVDGYPVPIDLNRAAAEIEVTPGHTTITYSHIALTVRQTMFAPDGGVSGGPASGSDATGAVVLFTIDSIRPVTLTCSFIPEMRPMWPRPGSGTPSAEWVPSASAYILHTDFPDFSGAVALPTAQSGVMAPYQEKPQTHPLEFKLRFDPARDAGKVYPLLMAVGQTTETAGRTALLARLEELNAGLPASYAQNEAHYAGLQRELTSIHTPDAAFDDAFAWAEVSIEQLRARLPATGKSGGQTGLVAGYYASGDSARPGFGWFFGRDALYTLSAVNAMGDFRLVRETMDFLMDRQRADGKMMHEYSQTAGAIDWGSLPYFYAAADATPLFLLAMQDYVDTSGDTAYLQRHREAILKAWQFEITHDSDGDGIYDNAQGTGWVESWPGGQPHQEIYLALLDRQACTAMGKLATLLGEAAVAEAAKARGVRLTDTLEREYFQPVSGDYAFSRNADGSLDHAATLYPALAWWAGGPGLRHPDASLRRWDSHDFATDWGMRDVAESDPVYDPISYHQGSVWPLFTGWAAMADYRSSRPLAGYAQLRHNADQTYTQDLGAVTELLSGAFFQPFGRSTTHQLWSSAMVITPTLRGLFGLTVDAANHTVTLAPQLPADWPSAEVLNLHVGDSVCTLTLERVAGRLRARSVTTSGPTVLLSGGGTSAQTVSLHLPGVEAALYQPLPAPGSRTSQVKVLSERYGSRSLTIELEGPGGSQAGLEIHTNNVRNVQAHGATLGEVRGDGTQHAMVNLPAGKGYQSATIVFTW